VLLGQTAILLYLLPLPQIVTTRSDFLLEMYKKRFCDLAPPGPTGVGRELQISPDTLAGFEEVTSQQGRAGREEKRAGEVTEGVSPPPIPPIPGSSTERVRCPVHLISAELRRDEMRGE